MKNLLNNGILWQTYNINIVLNENITHIFKIPINIYDKITNQYLEVLSNEEIEKAYRFKQKDDKKRYIIGKFFLRTILSKMLSIKPSTITFLHTKNKKAYIEEQQFNISHSGDLIVIAISPLPVGIDIEFVNQNFNFHPLLNECFTQSELLHINNRFDFYTFWTRKEAILKATGEGLTDNLHSMDCSKNIVFRNNTHLKLISNIINKEHIMSLAINDLCLEYDYWSVEV